MNTFESLLPLQGTLEELISIVPKHILNYILIIKSDPDYMFNIDIVDGFILVW